MNQDLEICLKKAMNSLYMARGFADEEIQIKIQDIENGLFLLMEVLNEK